jgi:hypothetical protein
MKNKDLIAFFRTVRVGNLSVVRDFVDSDPAYVNICCGKMPKNDAGQSALQIALKVGNLPVAEYLVEQGADVNFEGDKSFGQGSLPPLNSCVKYLVSICSTGNLQIYRDGIRLLRTLIARGANPNAVDSYGYNSLNRALVEIYVAWADPPDEFKSIEQIIFTRLREILKILIRAGADIHMASEEIDSAADHVKKLGLDKYKLF